MVVDSLMIDATLKETRRQRREPGEAIERRRGEALFEEDVVEALLSDFEEDLKTLWQALAPNGRPPFVLLLTPAEQQRRFAEATPEQWQEWAAQAELIPDERERDKALAVLFQAWYKAQQVGAQQVG